MRSKKLEIRNSKQIRMIKNRKFQNKLIPNFKFDFGFARLCLFRISSFGFRTLLWPACNDDRKMYVS
jgi:hypothetical protein